LAPLLMQRMRVPGLIGLILAGALVGPNGLNLLARDRPSCCSAPSACST
jgi:Kef-type K+ transport system membrane component KefB